VWGSAIAKRSVGIAFGVWGMRSLFWGCRDAIAFGDVGSAIAKRSVGIAFGNVGCDRFWGCWECDSEALRRNRFWECGVRSLLGMW
jgi:hypothetical protein